MVCSEPKRIRHMSRPLASLSLDLDNAWSYLKARGARGWEQAPSYLPTVVPIILELLARRKARITFFIVGRDAQAEENREALRLIAAAGHEFGNHSFNHEPWIERYEERVVQQELESADQAIRSATGHKPVGFRGPGYCFSSATLKAVRELGYDFDASVLPSVIGPAARLYYFWSAGLSREDRWARRRLYGSARDALLPLGPFHWQTRRGRLLEIPVTTIPLVRLPFHPSYVTWLSGKSRMLADTWLKFGVLLCRLRRVEPSIILHPLDFLGREDAPELAFFPGMDLTRADKLRIVDRYLRRIQQHFDVVTLSEHAAAIRRRGDELRLLEPHRVRR